MEISGRIGVDTRALEGLDLPLGEDLKVRDGPAGHSRLHSFCRRESGAREGSGMSGPPCRTKACLGGRGFKIHHSRDLMLGLGISIKPLDQWPCLCCRGPAGLVQAGGALLSPFPHLFPPPLGPSAPRVEADVLMQSSRCRPAHLGNYCLPAGGPAAAPQGKGCRGFFLGGKRYGPVGTLRAPQGSSVGPSGLSWRRNAWWARCG